MNQLLHRIAWWAFAIRMDWLGLLVYRYRCPYPLGGHNSARACSRAGLCGCDNGTRFGAHPNRGDAG